MTPDPAFAQVAITLRESTAIDEALGLVDSDDVDEAVLPAPSAGRRFTLAAVAEEEIAATGRPSGHTTARVNLGNRPR
ncbi:hypothetical protein OG985_07185 [Streptomyces sp. NBC_00289]|uniref:hypothetical protein n=1 Tax=Streptomyces sp. NBC_00289 TaxID=2975703 RepID=UPI0032467EDA